MKLLVIGHSVLDYIQSDRKVSRSAGGIYYTISALNRLIINKDEIFLCSQYDEESFHYFSLEFDKINRSHLVKVDVIPRVHLNFFKDKERHELYENITNNISMEISDFNEFDGLLINMITGFDITLDQLIDIRKNYSGLILMDVHTLSRGMDENYKRKFRLISDFNKWAKCIDIIQVNQNELFTLSAQKNESEIVQEIFDLGVKIICVTKGKYGAKVYFNESEEIISYFIAAKKISNPNVIGCGDVFGAAFFYFYITCKNVSYSLLKAVLTAELFVENKFLKNL